MLQGLIRYGQSSQFFKFYHIFENVWRLFHINIHLHVHNPGVWLNCGMNIWWYICSVEEIIQPSWMSDLLMNYRKTSINDFCRTLYIIHFNRKTKQTYPLHNPASQNIVILQFKFKIWKNVRFPAISSLSKF